MVSTTYVAQIHVFMGGHAHTGPLIRRLRTRALPRECHVHAQTTQIL